MWGKDLRRTVGLSKKNGPCEGSFFWARALAQGKHLLWSSGPLHLLGEGGPAGLGTELCASCPPCVSCGCRATAMAHLQVLATHQDVQCVDLLQQWQFLPAGAVVPTDPGQCWLAAMALQHGLSWPQIFLLEHQALPPLLLLWPGAFLLLAVVGPDSQFWDVKTGHGEETASWAELL